VKKASASEIERTAAAGRISASAFAFERRTDPIDLLVIVSDCQTPGRRNAAVR
jgi:hypothetical protein